MQEVITHLNKACGTSFPPFDKKARGLVAKLLVDGYTIEDIKAVNAWADRHWPRPNPGEKDWRATMVVPSKLYGEKFGEHLGVALGGATKSSDAAGRKTNDAGIPLEDIFGTSEYEAKMKHVPDEAERLDAK